MDQPNYDPKVRADFFDMYFKSRRAAIRALFVGTNGLDGQPIDALYRQAQCVELSKNGYVVDPQIDTGQFDAYTINAQAIQGGFKTRPKIGEVVPFCTPPGVSAPNIPNYNEFTFSIESTLDPVKYPVNTEPDVTVTEFVGQRANKEGGYNTQNSPETSINPLTGKVFEVGDRVWELKHWFTLFKTVTGMYMWQIEE